MISATASQEGPPAPHRPPPSAQQPPPRPLQPPVTHHALTPHHTLLHPPSAPSTMAQLPPLPLPLPLPHPLYPHHQLGPPPHPYHPLHPHHHHHHQHQLSTLNSAAAAAAMIAFDHHHHGRHHLTPHLLGTPPSGGSAPPPSTERSPSPPRFLRPPPPSRPVPNHLVPSHATAPSYNGVRNEERGEGGGGVERLEDRLKEGSEAVEMCRSEEDGGDGGAVNLVHKRITSQEDEMCAKRSRMVNGGLGGRANALGSFVPHSMYPPPASPYFPSSTSSPASLLSAPYSPTATSPSVSSPYSLHTSPSKHLPLHLHPYPPHASPPRHSPDHAPLPPSAPIAPTFTSPAITVGPITTPTSANFAYDPFFPSSSSSPVKPGQSVLRRPSLPPPPVTTSVSAPRLSLHHFPPPLPSAPAPASSPPQPQPQHPSPATAFKIPSGKEGSLKHRLLPPRSDGQNGALGPEPQSPTASCTLFKVSSSASSGGKRRKGNYTGSKGQNPSTSSSSSSTSSTPSPPGAGAKTGQQSKGGVLPSSNASSPPSASRSPLEDCFSKGSLIRLRGGRVVRVEELKTEDFVRSAEGSDAIRLDPSTVVALEERPEDGTARLTLAYGSDKLRSQVELESTLEQPFFVVGRGWASVCPERSLRRFGLSCLPLRIGHVCISLTERPNSKAAIKEELPKPSPFEIKIAEASNGERKQAVQPTPFVTTSCNTSNKLKTSQENLNSLPYESKQVQSGDLKLTKKSVCSPESSIPCDSEDNDKNQQRSLSPASRKRRWSAPGPLSNEEDEEEKTKPTAPAHLQQNSSGVASHHTAVDS